MVMGLEHARLWMEGLGFGMATELDYQQVALPPEEINASAGMLPARCRDFCMGRAAAHRALADLGAADGPIYATGRAARFPAGYVGSLSHSQGVAVAIAGPIDHFCSLGIDLELNPLPDSAAGLVLGQGDAEWFRRRTRSCAEAFSAKEAAYKALDPLLEGGAPPFRQMRLEPIAGGFKLRLLSRFHLEAFVAVRRVGHGVLAWMTVPAVSPWKSGVRTCSRMWSTPSP
jgi:enterobactin synthetase component D